MDITLYFSFFAGVVSILSPCILPIIPLIVAFSIKKRELSEIVSFITGLFSIFLIVIALTFIFTVAINEYLFYFRIISSVILIVLGFYILLNKGLFNFSFSTDHLLKKFNSKSLNAFLFGFLTSLAWAPCYSPYLLSVISYTTVQGNFVYSAVNVLVYTLGFALTILIISIFINKINLEKLLKHSEMFRIISATLIIFAGLYLFLLAI